MVEAQMNVEPRDLGQVVEVHHQLKVLLHSQQPVAFFELEHRCRE